MRRFVRLCRSPEEFEHLEARLKVHKAAMALVDEGKYAPDFSPTSDDLVCVVKSISEWITVGRNDLAASADPRFDQVRVTLYEEMQKSR